MAVSEENAFFSVFGANLPPNIGQVAQPTQKRLKNVINVKLSRLVIKKQDV